MTESTYEYTVLIYDTQGNKLHYIADELNRYDAESAARSWALEGGVDIDWVEVIETTDPNCVDL